MIATRLMLVELIRVVMERLIHLILFDYDSDAIYLGLNIHSTAGDTQALYDVAVRLYWVEHEGAQGGRWVCSRPSQSNTTIWL